MRKLVVVLSFFTVLSVGILVSTIRTSRSVESQEVLVPSPTAKIPIVGTKGEVAKVLLGNPEPTKTIKTLKLNEKRVVKIEGPIGFYKEVDETVKNKLKELGESEEPMFVLINSPGGSVHVGNEIVSLMQAANGPVYTVCVSLCASMAAIILEHGTKRFALDRTVVMFHDAAGGAEGSLGQMNSLLQFYRRVIEKTNRYIAERSLMKYEAFMDLQKDNLWIDAEDAKNLNLLDDLVRLK